MASEVEDDMFDNWDDEGFGDYDSDFEEDDGSEVENEIDSSNHIMLWNKLASLEAMLVQNYDRPTQWLTGVKCRATSVSSRSVRGAEGERHSAGESAQQGLAKSGRKLKLVSNDCN